MKGFLKRDVYLLLPNLWFYILFIGIMEVLSFYSGATVSSFVGLYVMIFSSSSLFGLFSHDEFNHWQAYAAAIPDGRRQQVHARYLLALLTGAGTLVLLLLMTWMSGDSGADVALLFDGMFFIYVAFLFPMSYLFGAKSRMSMILVIGIAAGGMSVGGSVIAISVGPGEETMLHGVGLPLFALALVLLAVSHRISLLIMARKEL